MIIYFVIFFISYLFAYISEKCKSHQNKKSFVLFSAIAILIPSIFAGLRASGVGTDTKIYIDWIFRANVSINTLKEMFAFAEESGIELLYCLLNFIVSRFTSNLSMIYFVLEVAFILFSYLACIKMSKRLNSSYSFSYLALLLLFYNKSLNMCRQSIAMAICLYSLEYIINRDWKKFFLFIALGYGFHRSVILFIPLYIIYSFFKNKDNLNTLIKVLIILVLLVAILFFKNIILYLSGIGIISSKYLNYVYVFGSSNNIKFIEIFSQTLIAAIVVLFNRRLINISRYNSFLNYIIIISFVTFLMGYNASYSQRISYYFSIIIIFIIPQMQKLFSHGKDKIFVSAIIVMILAVYSYLYYGKYSFDQTVPYNIEIGYEKNVR